MKKRIKIIRASVVVLLLLTPAASGQSGASLVPSESTVIVRGTSTLHDWEVEVKDFEVKVNIGYAENGDISIADIRARFSGASVDSESSIMTGKARDALQVKSHPFITFTSSGKINSPLKNGETSGSVTGDLVLTGVTQKAGVSFTGRITGDKIRITGSKKINMTDFGIRPPVAMLGALKTGEEVTVEFDFTFILGSR